MLGLKSGAGLTSGQVKLLGQLTFKENKVLGTGVRRLANECLHGVADSLLHQQTLLVLQVLVEWVLSEEVAAENLLHVSLLAGCSDVLTLVNSLMSAVRLSQGK